VHLPWLPIEALEGSRRLANDVVQETAFASSRSAGRSGSADPFSLERPKAGHALPRAIVELQGQTQYVVAPCEHAQRLGVRAGMSMAAALALVPGLQTCAKDEPREQQLLEKLATRAHRFTPRVSLAPPDGLLLEVKGSLHLFGGAAGLCHALEDECRASGVKPVLALAPVPLAALVGARAGRALRITDPAQLIGHIASLSLFTLRWPLEVIGRLQQVGVNTIGEVLRLPRGGFARRFGKAQLAMLDRLTGRDADLQHRFRARERFRRKHELLYELEQHEAILRTLEPLLQELGEFLKSRQCGITRLDCILQHRHAPPTRCVLRLAAPASNARHFTRLFGERLAALSLPEPVRACELRSGALVSRAPTAESLWQPGEHGGGASAEAPELIEHLRARLGHEAVYGLRMMEAHRPEKAWVATDLRSPEVPQRVSAASQPGTTPRIGRGYTRRLSAEGTGGAAKAAHPARATGKGAHGPQQALNVSGSPKQAGLPPWPAFRRPVWLLPAPEALIEREGLPRHGGALRLLAGPERVETGWWDGGDVSRDYYVALDVHGVRLWIFRERTPPHRWFLQGVFG